MEKDTSKLWGFLRKTLGKKGRIKMPFYRVKGKYIETNHQRTVRISAASENDIETEMMKKGFEPPFTYELDSDQTDYENDPTDSQLSYARDLGIRIPQDATKKDVSTLIDRAVEHETTDPSHELLQFAYGRGYNVSKYIGESSLYSALFNNLTGVDKVAFFVFCVYRHCTNDKRENLDTHPEKSFIYSIANEVIDDPSVVKSINRYYGHDLRSFGEISYVDSDGEECDYETGGSAQTIAYKAISKRIAEYYNVKRAQTKKVLVNQTNSMSNTPPPTTNINTPPPSYTPKEDKPFKKILGIFIIAFSMFATFILFDTSLFAFGWLFHGAAIASIWLFCSDWKKNVKVLLTVFLSLFALSSIMFGIAKIANPDLTFSEFADTLSSENTSSYSYYSSSKY